MFVKSTLLLVYSSYLKVQGLKLVRRPAVSPVFLPTSSPVPIPLSPTSNNSLQTPFSLNAASLWPDPLLDQFASSLPASDVSPPGLRVMFLDSDLFLQNLYMLRYLSLLHK